MSPSITDAEEKRYAELQQMALDFARHGETEQLAAMLDHGLPVNLSDPKGHSLLMLASYHGHLETTRMLLTHGAEVDRRNDRGQTPLGGVAFKGDEALVALLLEHGADIDADNGMGMTPIMFAAMFGRTKVVEQLRGHGASLAHRNRVGISARWLVRLSALFARVFRGRQSGAGVSSAQRQRPSASRVSSTLIVGYLACVGSTRAAPYLELAPMIGHTSATDTRIWVKASEAANLSVRLGSVPDLSDAREVSGPKLEVASAFMNHVVVSNLQPSTRYYYAVLLDGEPAMLRPYPSFTTAPPEGEPGRVRVAFTSCVGYHGYLATAGYADMARTNIDLLFLLGDNHYANTNDPGVQRQFYFDQRDTAGWRGLSPRLPIYAIWDDHDYGPDNSDGTLKGKELSLQTFKEHWANPAYGEPDNPGVYFQFTRANVDFFLLDDRYHRAPNKATNLAHKPHLGVRQVEWLKRGLLNSRAPIKVLASGGEWQSHGTDDSWTSFKEERDDLFRFVEEHKISGLLLLSGDRHFTGAYHVRGKWIEVTSGPLGSAPATVTKSPEAFLDFSATKGHYYCLYDLDTTASPPKVTLEIYRVGDGLVERRPFTWDEVTGAAQIKLLPPAAK